MFDSLVANAWANSYFRLGNNLVAPLDCHFQSNAVTITVKDNRLDDIQTGALVRESKRYSLLLTSAQHQLGISGSTVNSLDPVVCRSQKTIYRGVPGCDLKRDLARLPFQPFWRDQLKRYLVFPLAGNGVDLLLAVPILTDYPADNFRPSTIKRRLV
jgi:hypothetical protein